MLTSVIAGIVAAVIAVTASTNGGINPVQHSEARAAQETTAASKGINPVQHSE